MDFASAETMFRQDRIRELSEDQSGLRYLKLRTLSRREHILKVFASAKIEPPAETGTVLRAAFDSPAIKDAGIDAVARSIYAAESAERLKKEPMLVSELYKLQAFDWGDLHQNSLEKTIVDNYVKKVTNYEDLNSKIDNELLASMRGYVLCSWYNHWTSIIIEDVFRDHRSVLPAVGKVKKIDFFLQGVPFDLKVTSLPEGFVKERRRADAMKPELTLLKKAARCASVKFDKELADSRLLEDLWRKVSDLPGAEPQELIAELNNYRNAVLSNSQKDPDALIKWLYENQGVRRFDAANRLFLVLVDRSNFFGSWRLKRAKPLLEQKINAYLDSARARLGALADIYMGVAKIHGGFKWRRAFAVRRRRGGGDGPGENERTRSNDPHLYDAPLLEFWRMEVELPNRFPKI